jgi:hypothetical protein
LELDTDIKLVSFQVQKPAQYKYIYACIEHYLRTIDGTGDDLESDYVYS